MVNSHWHRAHNWIFLHLRFLLNHIIFTNPSARAGYDTRSIFKRSLTGLNSEFSFSETSCLTKAEDPCLSYYLPIAGGRIIGFIPFPRVLVLCEMQSVWSRFELVSPYPIPTTITITPRAPPHSLLNSLFLDYIFVYIHIFIYIYMYIYSI